MTGPLDEETTGTVNSVAQALLQGIGLPQQDELETISSRDYVKHWYYADNDVLQEQLVQALGLTEVAVQVS